MALLAQFLRALPWGLPSAGVGRPEEEESAQCVGRFMSREECRILTSDERQQSVTSAAKNNIHIKYQCFPSHWSIPAVVCSYYVQAKCCPPSWR